MVLLKPSVVSAFRRTVIAGGRMRASTLACAALAAALIVGFTTTPTALGKPGITPVPCPQQEWQYGDAAFEALPRANAFSGR